MGSIAPPKICRSKTSFDDLPHETAIDTFLRLPVKTLIRSTLVSKTWFSLIANPNFVSAQILRSISCCDKTPSVRKYKYLVSSCLHGRAVAGFGFVESTNDYRVVRIEYPADEKQCGKLAPKVEVFGLQINKWRKLENLNVLRVVVGSGTNVNSSVYWIDKLYTQTYLEEVWILSFDFNNEVFGQLKLSDDVRYCLGVEALFKLMEFEGSLSVCVYKVSDSIRSDGNRLSQTCCIWLMRQEDGKISWIIRFRVVLNELGCPYKISRNGSLIMVSFFHGRPNRSIMCCDLKSMHYRCLVFDNPLGENAMVAATVDTCFIESLVMHLGEDELLKSAR